LSGITNYRVYKLGTKYLEQIAVTSDSFLVLAKATNPSLHYAVAPLLEAKKGEELYN
jgi:hypothetical protein